MTFIANLQDFDTNGQLKQLTLDFLEDIACTSTLLPSEHRAASQLLKMLTKESSTNKMNLDIMLTSTEVSQLIFPWQPKVKSHMHRVRQVHNQQTGKSTTFLIFV